MRGYHGRRPNGKLEPCSKDLLRFLSPVGAQRPHCQSSTFARDSVGADGQLLAQLMGHRDARSFEKNAKLGSAAICAGLERLRKRARGEE